MITGLLKPGASSALQKQYLTRSNINSIVFRPLLPVFVMVTKSSLSLRKAQESRDRATARNGSSKFGSLRLNFIKYNDFELAGQQQQRYSFF